MKIQFEEKEKPNPKVNHIMLAQLVDTWFPKYQVLSSNGQHYTDEEGEEVPISAIIKWAEFDY